MPQIDSFGIKKSHLDKLLIIFLYPPKYHEIPLNPLKKSFPILSSSSYHSSVENEDGTLSHLNIFRETTSLRKVESQFRQAQKMEAIGLLAGGVAHDFNNILTVIRGHAELVQMNGVVDKVTLKHIKAIDKASTKAKKLTGQLLAFSRKQVILPEIIILDDVIVELLKMLTRLIGEDINIETHLQSGREPLLADRGQLEQLLINLAVNAADAIRAQSADSRKTIIFSTSQVFLDQDFQRSHPGSAAGEFLLLEVKDSGCGMNAETLTRIFEPFFTTKEKGHGTGLGLATVFGIVKQNHGSIYVESELGQGSSFKIYWPLANETEREVEVENKPRPEPRGGTESILLVEDDREMRQMTASLLQRFGYMVVTAENGEQALAEAQGCPEGFDLLFTDIVMPEMDGPTLSQKLLAIYPKIEILFTSGYFDGKINLDQKTLNSERFLHKPYEMVDLLDKIRILLDRKRMNDE